MGHPVKYSKIIPPVGYWDHWSFPGFETSHRMLLLPSCSAGICKLEEAVASAISGQDSWSRAICWRFNGLPKQGRIAGTRWPPVRQTKTGRRQSAVADPDPGALVQRQAEVRPYWASLKLLVGRQQRLLLSNARRVHLQRQADMPPRQARLKLMVDRRWRLLLAKAWRALLQYQVELPPRLATRKRGQAAKIKHRPLRCPSSNMPDVGGEFRQVAELPLLPRGPWLCALWRASGRLMVRLDEKTPPSSRNHKCQTGRLAASSSLSKAE